MLHLRLTEPDSDIIITSIGGVKGDPGADGATGAAGAAGSDGADGADGGGASNFLELDDTPSSFGTSGQIIVVNNSADGFDFMTAPSGGGGAFRFHRSRRYALDDHGKPDRPLERCWRCFGIRARDDCANQ